MHAYLGYNNKLQVLRIPLVLLLSDSFFALFRCLPPQVGTVVTSPSYCHQQLLLNENENANCILIQVLIRSFVGEVSYMFTQFTTSSFNQVLSVQQV